jgi:Ni/Co efflux regulator RcnB
MYFTRSMLLAALVASSASFAAALPAAADSGAATRTDLTVQIRYGDRDSYRDRDYRYRDRHHRRSDQRWRNQRRCYTDVDYRHRYGHRVRIVERICFRNGHRYVASRRIVRVGRHYW